MRNASDQQGENERQIKSASPSTVSNVKHRIEKFLHSGFKFIYLFIFFSFE